MNQSASPVGVPERLQVLESIGTGAFGKVFLTQDRSTGRRLALKRLERADPASIYRFKQEFRALADVKHHNLVRLHELFSVDSGWCFTMDYVDGVRFDTWVRGLERDRRPSSIDTTRSDEAAQSDGDSDAWDIPADSPPSSAALQHAAQPCDEPRLRASLRQLVDGVLALHGAGILHRDLKPSNVLVDHDGRVVILDFGLAATTADAAPSSTDGRFGTPAYMSPEQVRGGTLTMAADWYAVGIMLYEALTGRLPFSGYTNDMLAARLNRDPRPPLALSPDTPKDLAELCMACSIATRPRAPTAFRSLSASAWIPPRPTARSTCSAVPSWVARVSWPNWPKRSKRHARAARWSPTSPAPPVTARPHSSDASWPGSCWSARSWCSRGAATSANRCRSRRSTIWSTRSGATWRRFRPSRRQPYCRATAAPWYVCFPRSVAWT